MDQTLMGHEARMCLVRFVANVCMSTCGVPWRRSPATRPCRRGTLAALPPPPVRATENRGSQG